MIYKITSLHRYDDMNEFHALALSLDFLNWPSLEEHRLKENNLFQMNSWKTWLLVKIALGLFGKHR